MLLLRAFEAIAAESVHGKDGAEDVGLSDFGSFLASSAGRVLFGVALLSSGQSSAITTTFTGQYIMDGFLDIRLPLYARALITRAVAIIPCIAFAVAYPDGVALNRMVNVVNALLSLLLPFGFTPLVKYNASRAYMGEHATGRWETRLLYSLGFLVYLVDAAALSCPGGGVVRGPDRRDGARERRARAVDLPLRGVPGLLPGVERAVHRLAGVEGHDAVGE